MNILGITILLIVVPTLCFTLSIYLVFLIVGIIKNQKVLSSSIKLIELKIRKVHYYVFVGLLTIIVLYAVFQLFDDRSPDTIWFATLFQFDKWQTNLALGFIILVSVILLVFFIALIASKVAVVAKGIHTGFGFIEWHFLQDYIIDMQNSLLVLSTNKGTFLTLKGTTIPLKIATNDIPKAIFIFNKNKNKFNQGIQ